MYEIEHFVTHDNKDVYAEWTRKIQDTKLRIAVERRVNRIESGNFGDHKFCRDGVWELRIDLGPGYRIYYARTDRRVVLLICGGSKRTQSADIDRACRYWLEFQQRGS